MMSAAIEKISHQKRYVIKARLASLSGNIVDTFDNLLLGFLRHLFLQPQN
jgi:hypothetical protein